MIILDKSLWGCGPYGLVINYANDMAITAYPVYPRPQEKKVEYRLYDHSRQITVRVFI